MSNVKGPDEAQNLNFEDLVAQYQESVLRMCFLYKRDFNMENEENLLSRSRQQSDLENPPVY